MTTQTNDELTSIRSLVEQTHFSALSNGHYFVVWGMCIAAGIAYSELYVMFHLALSPLWAWATAIGAGWFYTMRMYRREQRKARTQSYAGRVLASVWISCGISMTVAFFVGGITGAVPSAAVAGLTAGFLAVAFHGTAVISGIRWLAYIAISWWVGAFVLFVIPLELRGLALSGCVLTLLVLPGVVLHARARKLASRTS